MELLVFHLSKPTIFSCPALIFQKTTRSKEIRLLFVSLSKKLIYDKNTHIWLWKMEKYLIMEKWKNF